MSLCRLMVMAYEGNNPEHIGYDDYDLKFGIGYATGYIEEGHTYDLIDGFDLKDFANWCRKKRVTP